LPATVEDVTVVGTIAFVDDEAVDVDLQGDYAIVSCRHSGRRVIDLTDAAVPQVVAEYARPGWFAHCLQADHGTIYANGLWLLKHEDPTGCRPPRPAAARYRPESPW